MQKCFPLSIAVFLSFTCFVNHSSSAEWTEAQTEAELAARERVPEGGNFQPNPQMPVTVAVGGGGRVILSVDDGQSWEQVFFGAPTHGHGYWATRSVAFTDGLFIMPVGWGKPPMALASDDGRNWRHLLPPKTEQDGEEPIDPLDMPGCWTLGAGGGTFVWGAHRLTATPDFGKSWYETHIGRATRDDPRKLSTHHLKPFYLGEEGRFFVLAQDRSKENTQVANLFLTEDDGQTWQWLETSGLENGDGKPADFAFIGDIWVISTREGQIYRSTDQGRHWEGPFDLGARSRALSVVNGEFWVTGNQSFSSKDGKEWTPLPESIPEGSVYQTPSGALLSIDNGRSQILRSSDDGETWEEVFSFEPVEGAKGLIDIEFGAVKPANPGASRGASFRTWTARNGDQVEARLVGAEAGVVTLETKKGREIDVKLEVLTSADRQFVSSGN